MIAPPPGGLPDEEYDPSQDDLGEAIMRVVHANPGIVVKHAAEALDLHRDTVGDKVRAMARNPGDTPILKVALDLNQTATLWIREHAPPALHTPDDDVVPLRVAEHAAALADPTIRTTRAGERGLTQATGLDKGTQASYEDWLTKHLRWPNQPVLHDDAPGAPAPTRAFVTWVDRWHQTLQEETTLYTLPWRKTETATTYLHAARRHLDGQATPPQHRG